LYLCPQTDLARRTLLMLFEKPSLRTRVSFETAMTQLGGHAIFYSVHDSPLGEKETVADTARTLSRYVDAVTARVKSRATVAALCAHATVPVINALDDYAHPCQTLTDLLTLRERFPTLRGVRMAYLGDTRNNVTYDLMRAACLLGLDLRVAGPPCVRLAHGPSRLAKDADVWCACRGPAYAVEDQVLAECAALARTGGGSVRLTHDAAEAVAGADAVYTDSWMSYGIPSAAKAERHAQLLPYQVSRALMARAQPHAVFMNCLPAMRGMEQEAAVIDGPQSIVFDQAENRLHTQKALLHTLLLA
jgi:ornithine carbamoyltransferase